MGSRQQAQLLSVLVGAIPRRVLSFSARPATLRTLMVESLMFSREVSRARETQSFTD